MQSLHFKNNADFSDGDNEMLASAEIAPSKKPCPQAVTRKIKSSISDRHVSPVLRALPAARLQMGTLTGVKAKIYNQLWRSIAEGRVKPGTKLQERLIREQMDVSRMLVISVFQQMAAEGIVVFPMNKSPYVARPSPREAQDVLTALDLNMAHVIWELSAQSRQIPEEQRDWIDRHLRMMTDDLPTAHLLESELLILLAVVCGNVLLTEQVTRAVVLRTLSLKLYSEFPPKSWSFASWRSLVDAIFAHQPEVALREYEARSLELRRSMRFGMSYQEYQDIARSFETVPRGFGRLGGA
ncbi:MAG: GntR family transcriptional regulator [Gallionellaceae bacterium]|jgi:DNA-binding GntR family transcriptional regulator|nr:GntR family transcriptional regulator [Gallionellaceae bacterium]